MTKIYFFTRFLHNREYTSIHMTLQRTPTFKTLQRTPTYKYQVQVKQTMTELPVCHSLYKYIYIYNIIC
jgi:hypothetical protein